MLTEDAFEKACLLGAKTAEIFFNCAEELEYPLLKEFIDIKEKYNVTVNSIHPYTSFAEPNVLFGNYKRRVKEGVEFYKRYFFAAQALGAKAVVLHGGKPAFTEEKTQEYLETYNALCDEADKFRVSPAIEIVVDRMGQSLDFMSAVKNNSDGRFKTVLDIKQCRRAGVNEFDFIEKFCSDIIQVHISDYNSELDCLPPGEGEYDFKKLFTALKNHGYDESAVIELYNWGYSDENQIKNARIYLENL